jgi:hypothetical protein
LEGPNGPTVTEMFDRCRDAVTAAGERCRVCPGESATACVGGRGVPRSLAAPPITPPAGVVVKPGATVTTAHIDAPDLRGRRGGLGTRVGVGQAWLSRRRGRDLVDGWAT